MSVDWRHPVRNEGILLDTPTDPGRTGAGRRRTASSGALPLGEGDHGGIRRVGLVGGDAGRHLQS